MNKTINLIIVSLILAAAIVGSIFVFAIREPEKKQVVDQNQQLNDQANLQDPAAQFRSPPPADPNLESTTAPAPNSDLNTFTDPTTITYQYFGQLSDVTKGQTVRGINTSGNSSGQAQATFQDGTYSMFATFENLPTPQGDDFYEGWVVRSQPFKAMSTGRTHVYNGKDENFFQTSEDLTDFDFYVLTLEPNDGDPAPADHIVEGTMFLTQ